MTTALTNLYVRNLPMEWTSADLIALGEKYGPVVSAKVLFNPLTTASRGMGFIRFAEHADATLAIAGMNGHIPDSQLHAKPLNVQFAKDQQSAHSTHTPHHTNTREPHTCNTHDTQRTQRPRQTSGATLMPSAVAVAAAVSVAVVGVWQQRSDRTRWHRSTGSLVAPPVAGGDGLSAVVPPSFAGGASTPSVAPSSDTAHSA